MKSLYISVVVKRTGTVIKRIELLSLSKIK